MRYSFLSSFLFAGMVSAKSMIMSTVSLAGMGSPCLQEQVANSRFEVGPYTLNIGGRSVAALVDLLSGPHHCEHDLVGHTTTLNNSDLSATYHPFNAIQYEEAAYLFNQIGAPGLSDADQIAIQNAAWYIFSPSDVENVMNAASYGFFTSSRLYADGMMTSAFAIVSSVDPVDNRQEEFLTSSAVPTPEPSNIMLNAVGMLLLTFGLLKKSFRAIWR